MHQELFAILIASVLVGMAGTAITSTVRALVPEPWLIKKPVGCDLCMSTWTSLAIVTVLYVISHEYQCWMAWLPAMTVQIWILSRLHQTPSSPPPEI